MSDHGVAGGSMCTTPHKTERAATRQWPVWGDPTNVLPFSFLTVFDKIDDIWICSSLISPLRFSSAIKDRKCNTTKMVEADATKDHYAALGLPPGANEAEIKKRYKELGRICDVELSEIEFLR
jgi:hypothetical protein